MTNKKMVFYGVVAAAFTLSFAVYADEVVLDDLIVDGSACVGAECVQCLAEGLEGEPCADPADGEVFAFDTLRLKDSDPQIHFQDTSSTSAFPANDWRMGIADDEATGSAFFFITDANSGDDVLVMRAADAGGGVAIGAGSTVVDDAISVGASGAERRIVNLAAGTGDTDAVNVGQFDAFTTQIATDCAEDAAGIQTDVAAAQARIDALNTRLDGLLAQVELLSTPDD